MKKFLLCSLMAFCLTLTASASTIGYEPPKVGIEMPDIGYSAPAVDVIEVVACDYEMMQTATVQVIMDAVDAQLNAVSASPVAFRLKSKSLNVPKPITKRVDNTFRQRSQNPACCSKGSGYIFNRFHNMI